MSTETTTPEEWQSSEHQRLQLKHWLFLFCLLIVLVVFSALYVKKKNAATHAWMSTCHMRSLYCVLMDFESDMGKFPDDETAASDEDLQNFHGSYSNDYLGQLIAGGYLVSEDIFYAKDNRFNVAKIDCITKPKEEILRANECGMSYIIAEQNGVKSGLSTKYNGQLPILAAPMSSHEGAFEPTSYDNHGVYLRIDGSAHKAKLRSSDHKIVLENGHTLFETGPGTPWGTSMKPIILLPKR